MWLLVWVSLAQHSAEIFFFTVSSNVSSPWNCPKGQNYSFHSLCADRPKVWAFTVSRVVTRQGIEPLVSSSADNLLLLTSRQLLLRTRRVRLEFFTAAGVLCPTVLLIFSERHCFISIWRHRIYQDMYSSATSQRIELPVLNWEKWRLF